MRSVIMEQTTLRYDNASVVCDKNTFVTVVAASSETCPRSTKSLPPSLRLFHDRPRSLTKLPHECLKQNVFRSASLAERSTAAGSSIANESDVSSDDGGESHIQNDAQSESCCTPVSRETANPVAIALCDLVAPPTKQRLNTKAKVFVSRSVSFASPLRSQMDYILANIRSGLVAVGVVVQLCIVPGFHDWSIVATIPRKCSKKEVVLSAAKEALLQACERSASMYCLGYEASPFSSTPDGFSSKLTRMEDEQRACWDFFSKGSCRRGCQCQWEHPKEVVTLNMSVVEADHA